MNTPLGLSQIGRLAGEVADFFGGPYGPKRTGLFFPAGTQLVAQSVPGHRQPAQLHAGRHLGLGRAGEAAPGGGTEERQPCPKPTSCSHSQRTPIPGRRSWLKCGSRRRNYRADFSP